MLLPDIVHYFLPHHTNNHRAKLLHPSGLAVFLLVALLLHGVINVFSKAQPEVLGIATNINVEDLLERTNEKRVAAGLQPLQLDPQLSQAAEEKAHYMFDHNFWAHTAPDGTTPWEFFKRVNYQYLHAGENLAKEFDDSSSVVDAWIASPSHKANLLKPEYRDIGFAVVNGTLNGTETTLVVQLFGVKRANTVASNDIPIQPTLAMKPQTVQTLGDTVGVSQVVSKTSLLNSFSLSKQWSLTLGTALLMVFVLDGFILWKRGIVRMTGHNSAHALFLVILLGAVWVTNFGAIL